jgi:16S rRNA (guanine527-N7)-methyltransferase
MPERRRGRDDNRSRRSSAPRRKPVARESSRSETTLLEDLIARLPGVEDPAALTLAITEYLAELREWNARGNLVSPSDLGRLVSRHVAESLAALPWIDRANAAQIIDVGSGGGFPIVPLKLIRPSLRVALVESRRMKSLFLRRVATRLDLQNFWVWNMRIETLAELPAAPGTAGLEAVAEGTSEDAPRVRPIVDLVTARAVAPLADLARWSERLVSPGGRLLAYKGSRLSQEIEDWKRAPGSWRLEEVSPVSPEIQIAVLRRG